MEEYNDRYDQLYQYLEQLPYLKKHVSEYISKGNPTPSFAEKLTDEHKKISIPNLIYPIGQNVFIHVDGLDVSGDSYPKYHVLMPDPPNEFLFNAVEKIFAKRASVRKPPEDRNERIDIIKEHLESICQTTNQEVIYDDTLEGNFKKNKIQVNVNDYESLQYYFIRKRVGLDLLEPYLTDPYIEDITMIGTGKSYVVHKFFGPMRVTQRITNDEIEEMLMAMAEQFGKTISHARPIVDATLPDGSRINIVFGTDVSRKGTNLTIRRFAGVPMSVTQLIKYGTMDAREAAYLWMMLNEGMSLFVCGETASGKTTSMTALTTFIPPTWKVVSIEDTPELALPHKNWVSEVTRDTGSDRSTITMQHLLKASLRQRPNYIIVGEIRGAEASVAFQAMQTGHPVISTFHAATVSSLIQRLTNEPIKIPKTNIDNLNLALMQGAVQGPDGRLVRRVLSINEIVGYDSSVDNILFIPLFNWESATDTVTYKGKGSSALFANKILQARGLTKKNEGLLYEELEKRAQILTELANKNIFNYYDVFEHIAKVNEIGIDSYMKELLV